MKRVYADMVADLFHWGHVNFLRVAKSYGDVLVIGVHDDKDVETYKRRPVLTMTERIKVVESCKYVNEVIPYAPITITKDYLDRNYIDIVVTVDNRPPSQLKLMYEIPLKYNMLKLVKYTEEISTTDIIKRIKDREDLV